MHGQRCPHRFGQLAVQLEVGRPVFQKGHGELWQPGRRRRAGRILCRGRQRRDRTQQQPRGEQPAGDRKAVAVWQRRFSVPEFWASHDNGARRCVPVVSRPCRVRAALRGRDGGRTDRPRPARRMPAGPAHNLCGCNAASTNLTQNQQLMRDFGHARATAQGLAVNFGALSAAPEPCWHSLCYLESRRRLALPSLSTPLPMLRRSLTVPRGTRPSPLGRVPLPFLFHSFLAPMAARKAC